MATEVTEGGVGKIRFPDNHEKPISLRVQQISQYDGMCRLELHDNTDQLSCLISANVWCFQYEKRLKEGTVITLRKGQYKFQLVEEKSVLVIIKNFTINDGRQAEEEAMSICLADLSPAMQRDWRVKA